MLKLDRLGLQVAVITIERTIVDLFDRYDLASGAEELSNSLDFVVWVDTTALIRYARTFGNASAAGALGSWAGTQPEADGRLEDPVSDNALKDQQQTSEVEAWTRPDRITGQLARPRRSDQARTVMETYDAGPDAIRSAPFSLRCYALS